MKQKADFHFNEAIKQYTEAERLFRVQGDEQKSLLAKRMREQAIDRNNHKQGVKMQAIKIPDPTLRKFIALKESGYPVSQADKAKQLGVSQASLSFAIKQYKKRMKA